METNPLCLLSKHQNICLVYYNRKLFIQLKLPSMYDICYGQYLGHLQGNMNIHVRAI